MFGIFGKRRKNTNSNSDSDKMIDDFLARGGHEGRADILPGWSLMLRSPYETSGGVSSWLGGLPCAPRNFKWPRDDDGTPQHFFAQIDLAALKHEPKTVSCPPGLPDQGALLVFAGSAYSCHVLSADEMATAVQLTCPEDLAPTRNKHGFFSEERTINYWPIYIVAFLDNGDERPAIFNENFKDPANWITTWAVAAIDAQIAIDGLKSELQSGKQFNGKRARFLQPRRNQYERKVFDSNVEHYDLMKRHAPELISVLEVWLQTALKKPPEMPVDLASLNDIFCQRQSLCDEMQNSQHNFIKRILLGDSKSVWEAIIREYPQLDKFEDFKILPLAYRFFIEAKIKDWRGHRLFGLEPPFGNNGEDLREQDCFISIAADVLLGTQSDHEYGLSIWCPRDDMDNSRFDTGQLVRHCAV